MADLASIAVVGGSGFYEFLEGAAILVGENDCVVGIAGVLESVLGRASLSFRGFRALGSGSIDARLIGTIMAAHVISVSDELGKGGG